MDRSALKSPTLLIVVAALCAGLAGLYFGGQLSGSKPANFSNKVLLYPQGRPLADFQLQQSDGSPFGNAQLQGRWSVLFFGFRNCPDVCPATLAQLAPVQRQLSAALPASAVPQFVFVSVDPSRDSGAALTEYVSYFNPALLAVTSAEPGLRRFAEQLGAQYVLQEADSEGRYNVDHSADLFLIGPDGMRRGIIRPPFDVAGLIKDFEALTQ
jgi:protein SCO1/2